MRCGVWKCAEKQWYLHAVSQLTSDWEDTSLPVGQLVSLHPLISTRFDLWQDSEAGPWLICGALLNVRSERTGQVCVETDDRRWNKKLWLNKVNVSKWSYITGSATLFRSNKPNNTGRAEELCLFTHNAALHSGVKLFVFIRSKWNDVTPDQRSVCFISSLTVLCFN